MFELSVAFKYLIPRWRQLSVSIISLISTLVIALVVWLIVVFFSVKDGLENSWIEKMVALTAPVRMTPTEAYYRSYYHLVDTISLQSNYSDKSIAEKLAAPAADPYDPDVDEEIPAAWQQPDRDEDGQVKDLVKLAFQAVHELKGITGLNVSDYENAVANTRIRLLRHDKQQFAQQFLENASLVSTFDADNPLIAKALFAPRPEDYDNLLAMQEIASDNIVEDTPNAIHKVDRHLLRKRLKRYFDAIEISALQAPPEGWKLLQDFWPEEGTFTVSVVSHQDKIAKVIIAENAPDVTAVQGTLHLDHGAATLAIEGDKPQTLPLNTPIWLQTNKPLKAELAVSSLDMANASGDPVFNIIAEIQNQRLVGDVAIDGLKVAQAVQKADYSKAVDGLGEAIFLPKGFRESGALIGDQGYLSYYSPTPSSIQEQRIPVVVAGFYDPGIIPIGGKIVLAGRELTALIRSSMPHEGTQFANGINVRFDNIQDAPKVKAALDTALKEKGIAPYWHLSTYQDYDFTKDIVQQLQSEKNLFTLISMVIIIVACSNIISMLIILVNDKKLEIGILRSMGATSTSIAAIFGICGIIMGSIGSVLGIVAALLTLRHVNEVVGFISSIQGYDLFNPLFYGNTLPTTLSFDALTFVMATTVCVSLLAGIIPAIKACLMRPSAILRAE